MEQEIKIRKNPEILPRTLTLGISRNWDNFFCTEFSRKTQNKNKKYKFKKNIKIKNLSFSNKNWDKKLKSGKIRKSFLGH